MLILYKKTRHIIKNLHYLIQKANLNELQRIKFIQKMLSDYNANELYIGKKI